MNDGGSRFKTLSREGNFQTKGRILARRFIDADGTPIQTEIGDIGCDLHARRFVDQFRGGDELKSNYSAPFLVHRIRFRGPEQLLS